MMDYRVGQAGGEGEGPQDCGTFFMDVLGPYTPEQIHLSWTDELRPTSDDIERFIETTWNTCTAQAESTGAKLWNGRLCRLVTYHGTKDEMSLVLGPTDYRDFLGTNLHNAHLRYSHGPECLANPVGVSALVISSDDYLVLGRRSNAVAYHAGRIHPVGGCMEPSEAGIGENPTETILSEVAEEFGIDGQVVKQTMCLGLIRDKHIVQPEVMYDIHVELDAESIRRSATDASDRHEHTEVLVVRDHPANVVSFVERWFSDLTPVGLAGLLLHGLHAWGGGWFATTRGYLRRLI